jgi:hypothetical protein
MVTDPQLARGAAAAVRRRATPSELLYMALTYDTSFYSGAVNLYETWA